MLAPKSKAVAPKMFWHSNVVEKRFSVATKRFGLFRAWDTWPCNSVPFWARRRVSYVSPSSQEWLKAELDAPSGPLKIVEATWRGTQQITQCLRPPVPWACWLASRSISRCMRVDPDVPGWPVLVGRTFWMLWLQVPSPLAVWPTSGSHRSQTCNRPQFPGYVFLFGMELFAVPLAPEVPSKFPFRSSRGLQPAGRRVVLYGHRASPPIATHLSILTSCDDICGARLVMIASLYRTPRGETGAGSDSMAFFLGP